MHNLEQPQFDRDASFVPEGPKQFSEAERIQRKTNLDLKQFAEEAAAEEVSAKLLSELLNGRPELQAFLKNNKE